MDLFERIVWKLRLTFKIAFWMLMAFMFGLVWLTFLVSIMALKMIF